MTHTECFKNTLQIHVLFMELSKHTQKHLFVLFASITLLKSYDCKIPFKEMRFVQQSFYEIT